MRDTYKPDTGEYAHYDKMYKEVESLDQFNTKDFDRTKLDTQKLLDIFALYTAHLNQQKALESQAQEKREALCKPLVQHLERAKTDLEQLEYEHVSADDALGLVLVDQKVEKTQKQQLIEALEYRLK